MKETATCTRRAFRLLTHPEPSPELHAWIMAAVRAEAARQRRRRRLRRCAALGLTLLLTRIVVAHGDAR